MNSLVDLNKQNINNDAFPHEKNALDVLVSLTITIPLTMSGFHKLCGINPDQHFYLHLNKEMDFQHLDFTITSVAAGRSLFFL
jgi:hypothetical protein